MFQVIKKSTRKISFLTLALTLALCANFAFGAWSNPPANPPRNNTAAPLNVSNDAQVKNGGLGLRYAAIISTFPNITFDDTTSGQKGSRIVNNSSRLYFQANRGTTNNPNWESGLVLNSANSSGGKYAKVYGTLRADEYCDANGNNCFSGAPSIPAETDPQVGGLEGGKWCRANNAGTGIWCREDKPMTSCRWVTNTRDLNRYGRISAHCDNDEYLSGGSCNTNGDYSPPNFPISPNNSYYQGTSKNQRSGQLAWQCAMQSDDRGHTTVYAMCCS